MEHFYESGRKFEESGQRPGEVQPLRDISKLSCPQNTWAILNSVDRKHREGGWGAFTFSAERWEPLLRGCLISDLTERVGGGGGASPSQTLEREPAG